MIFRPDTIDRTRAARSARRVMRRARAAGKRLTWAKANAIGRASARVVIGQPAWPTAEQAVELKVTSSAKPKRLARYKRDPRGDWWMSKLADLVEARRHVTVPEYSPRAGRRIKARGKRTEREIKREGYEPEKIE